MPAQETPWVRSVVTVAGELEREAKSRRFNAIEAFMLMTLVLGSLWIGHYYYGVILGIKTAVVLSWGLLVLGSLYLLFVAPILHHDTLQSWGLGGPRHNWAYFKAASPEKKIFLALFLGGLFLALNAVNMSYWPEVAKFLQMDKLQVGGRMVKEFHQFFPGQILVVLVGTILSTLIITCAIRYDNFWPAFKVAMVISALMFASILFAAYLQRGPEVFTVFTDAAKFRKLGIDIFGYIFWGFTQQVVFSAYFGTRLRKAFPPSTDPFNSVERGKRWISAATFGIGIGAVGSTLMYLLVRYAHNNPKEPLSPEALAAGVPFYTVLYFIAFLAPLGAIYGYFYAQDRRRMMVATLSASCFGLIHIDSYGLVIGTWILGIMLVYVFMNDRTRNLVALAFIHGTLGSTFSLFFARKESGAMRVDYKVGPEGVEDPTMAVLIIPVLCMLIYIGFSIWSWHNLNERPRQQMGLKELKEMG